MTFLDKLKTISGKIKKFITGDSVSSVPTSIPTPIPIPTPMPNAPIPESRPMPAIIQSPQTKTPTSSDVFLLSPSSPVSVQPAPNLELPPFSVPVPQKINLSELSRGEKPISSLTIKDLQNRVSELQNHFQDFYSKFSIPSSTLLPIEQTPPQADKTTFLSQYEDLSSKLEIDKMTQDLNRFRTRILAASEAYDRLIDELRAETGVPQSIREKRINLLEGTRNREINFLTTQYNLLLGDLERRRDILKDQLGLLKEEKSEEEKKRDNSRLMINQLITSGVLGELGETSLKSLSQTSGFDLDILRDAQRAIKTKNELEIQKKTLQINNFDDFQKAKFKAITNNMPPELATEAENLFKEGMVNEAFSIFAPYLRTGKGGADRLLTPDEAIKFGVPYGTRTSEVIGMVPLTPTQREALLAFAPAKAILDDISRLSKKVNTGSGGIQRFLTGVLRKGQAALQTKGIGEAAALFEAQKAKLSLLTRALGEKGVLTTQDVERVANSLPKLGDSKTVAEGKLVNLKNLIDDIEKRLQGGFSQPIIPEQRPSLESIFE